MPLYPRRKTCLPAVAAVVMALGCVPILSGASSTQGAAQNPPGRAGRLALVDGAVTYHTADHRAPVRNCEWRRGCCLCASARARTPHHSVAPTANARLAPPRTLAAVRQRGATPASQPQRQAPALAQPGAAQHMPGSPLGKQEVVRISGRPVLRLFQRLPAVRLRAVHLQLRGRRLRPWRVQRRNRLRSMLPDKRGPRL
jgi:hypothetical protein